MSLDDDDDDDARAWREAACGRSISLSCFACDEEEEEEDASGCGDWRCCCEFSSEAEASSNDVEVGGRRWPHREVDAVNANEVDDGEMKREARTIDLASGEIMIQFRRRMVNGDGII